MAVIAKKAPYGEASVTITRTFDAPRKLVWQAWTDPKMMAQWFGPRGFTNPFCELDVRPGGSLRIVMRGPDGNDYPMNQLKKAGVDLSRPDTVLAIVNELDTLVTRLEAELAALA